MNGEMAKKHEGLGMTSVFRWTPAVSLLLLVVFAFAVPTIASAEGIAPPKEEAPWPVDRLIGQRMSNFRLKDAANGREVSLYGYRGNLAVVLVFFGTDCPVGDLYAPRLAALKKEFKDRKVAFVGVNSNAHETAAQVAAYAKEHGLDFPVVKDDGNIVADMAMIERTPEVVVLDGLATIRYRGAIDNQYGVGTRKPEPTKNFLREALEEIVTGGRIDVKATPVVGCLLDRVPPKPATIIGSGPRVRAAAPTIIESLHADDEAEEAKVGAVTYSGAVASIIAEKCQTCHRPGEVGPFPLLTYDDVRKHSAMLREVVDDRRMPPWHADPRIGHFKNDRSLTARERATLMAWVAQGTPLGDPRAIPAPKTFPEGWSIGKPDVVFEVAQAYTVPAQGTVDYIHTRVPTQFKEDVWVQAAEARPGNRAVVHHIIVYIIDRAALLRGGGVGGGLDRRGDSHLCGYAPGDMPSVYSDGAAKKIPAGSDLLFEIHYTPNGKVHTDRPKVGLIFAKGPVTQRAHTLGIANPRFEIPPGADDVKVNSDFTFPVDAHLLSFMPHMHLRGKSFSYKAVYPDGRTENLLSVPSFDYGWQTYYSLAEPKAMPKGTKIFCEAHFDNSSKNPFNPDPSKRVRWGEQTWDEMMIGYIDFVDDAKVSTKTAQTSSNSSGVGQALRLLNRAAARPAVAK